MTNVNNLMINLFKKPKEIKKLLNENFPEFMKYCEEHEIPSIVHKMILMYVVEKEIIENNLLKIFAGVGIKNIKIIKEILLKRFSWTEEQISEYINKNFGYFLSKDLEDEQEDINLLNLVFEDLSRIKNINLSNIRFKGLGTYKDVYICEDNKGKSVIIKIGKPRYCKTVPFMHEFMYPMFHKKIGNLEIEFTRLGRKNM